MVIVALSGILVSSCGGGKGCGTVDKLFNEPGCHANGTSAKRIFTGASAACGAPGSRKMQISCPASSGSAGQCTSGETGASIVSIMLSASQTTYASCNDVVTAYAGGSLTGIAGIFVSTPGDPTTTIDCSAGPCVRTTPTCYSTWDEAGQAPTGTSANLTSSTNYQYCTYIDTVNFNGVSPSITAGGASASSWSGTVPTVTIGGAGANVLFDASMNWVDALP